MYTRRFSIPGLSSEVSMERIGSIDPSSIFVVSSSPCSSVGGSKGVSCAYTFPKAFLASFAFFSASFFAAFSSSASFFSPLLSFFVRNSSSLTPGKVVIRPSSFMVALRRMKSCTAMYPNKNSWAKKKNRLMKSPAWQAFCQWVSPKAHWPLESLRMLGVNDVRRGAKLAILALKPNGISFPKHFLTYWCTMKAAETSSSSLWPLSALNSSWQSYFLKNCAASLLCSLKLGAPR
mmetsp:Transcript_1772/g.3164  ORF Transcript_1772/g.3164 Transcript_1772/m.3164 type:complete len:234 (+) Transcript_1772:432-1133(+)